MKKKQVIALLGSIILFIGVFMPIISVPMIGNMNYFQNGKGDGVIIIILAFLSIIFSFLNKNQGLWFTGIGSLIVLLFTFVNFQMKLSELKSQMAIELEGNPFGGLADLAMQSVQLQWGWAVLIVGTVMIIVSAIIKEEKSSASI